jgi:hypothetical protein
MVLSFLPAEVGDVFGLHCRRVALCRTSAVTSDPKAILLAVANLKESIAVITIRGTAPPKHGTPEVAQGAIRDRHVGNRNGVTGTGAAPQLPEAL